ncbi:MAG: hypothetical protein MJY62_02180, partial [Bacteroidales bacterium]|nr:hypothetical protein [Bacteroidales bacterium]
GREIGLPKRASVCVGSRQPEICAPEERRGVFLLSPAGKSAFRRALVCVFALAGGFFGLRKHVLAVFMLAGGFFVLRKHVLAIFVLASGDFGPGRVATHQKMGRTASGR